MSEININTVTMIETFNINQAKKNSGPMKFPHLGKSSGT